MVGFREQFSSRVAELARCEVLAPPVGELLAPLSELLTRLVDPRARAADRSRGRRQCRSAGAARARCAHSPRIAIAAARVRTGARRALVPADRAGSIRCARCTSRRRRLTMRCRTFDLRLQFEPERLRPGQRGAQPRAGGPRRRVARTRRAIERCSTCIAGSAISRCRWRGAPRSVIGVEGEAALVARSRANAERNGIGNATFHSANLAGADFAAAVWAQRSYSHVLLDPPRVGAREVLPLRQARRRAAPGVRVLPSGEPGARSGHPGARARIRIALRPVSPTCSRRPRTWNRSRYSAPAEATMSATMNAAEQHA